MKMSRAQRRAAVWSLLCDRAGISAAARSAFMGSVRLDSREREEAADEEETAPTGRGVRVEDQVLHLQGPILSDEMQWILDCFDLPGICPTAFAEAIGAMAGEIEFHVNSPGGDVTAMNMMLSALMDWRKKDADAGGGFTANQIVEARVTGIAASAAVSLLTTSRRCRVTAMPQAALMVHEPSLGGMTAKTLRQFAVMLDDDTETLVDQYAAARNLDRDAVMAEVREETWMSARRGRRNGWLDHIYPVVEDAEDPEEDAAGKSAAEADPDETASAPATIAPDATSTATDQAGTPAGENAAGESAPAENDSNEAPAGDAAGEVTTDRGSRSLLRRVRRRRR